METILSRVRLMVNGVEETLVVESRRTLLDALRLIEVEYETLPFVLDLEDALRPDAPKLRECGAAARGNCAGEPTVYQRGDPEAGFHVDG